VKGNQSNQIRGGVRGERSDKRGKEKASEREREKVGDGDRMEVQGERRPRHGRGKEGELFLPWKVGLTEKLTDWTEDRQ